MSFRLVLRGTAALVLMLVLATPVLAGGWAVVTLDELPAGVVTNTPVTVGFVIRQHGQTAWRSNDVIVYATNEETGGRIEVPAVEKGSAGHYTANLTFPSAGTWHWAVASGLLPSFQPMPDLEAVALSREILHSLPLVVWTSGVALAPARHADLLGELAGPNSGARRGFELFLAKGCVTCHTHAAVDSEEVGLQDFAFGPDLTHLNLDSEYLHRWLENPSAIKPGTQMPTLGLKETEIEALVSFLIPATAGQ